MQQQPETVKDELRLFLGGPPPQFKEIEDYMLVQRGKAIEAANLELKQHQLADLRVLTEMRVNNETIALLYHATGTGKTVTAVMDAKRCAGRTLFWHILGSWLIRRQKSLADCGRRFSVGSFY